MHSNSVLFWGWGVWDWVHSNIRQERKLFPYRRDEKSLTLFRQNFRMQPDFFAIIVISCNALRLLFESELAFFVFSRLLTNSWRQKETIKHRNDIWRKMFHEKVAENGSHKTPRTWLKLSMEPKSASGLAVRGVEATKKYRQKFFRD